MQQVARIVCVRMTENSGLTKVAARIAFTPPSQHIILLCDERLGRPNAHALRPCPPQVLVYVNRPALAWHECALATLPINFHTMFERRFAHSGHARDRWVQFSITKTLQIARTKRSDNPVLDIPERSLRGGLGWKVDEHDALRHSSNIRSLQQDHAAEGASHQTSRTAYGISNGGPGSVHT